MRFVAALLRPEAAALGLAVLQLLGAPKVANADSRPSDLSGARECALGVGGEDYHPCTLSARPDGRIDVKQPGKDTFDGTLTPTGDLLHLDGTYRLSEGTETHLTGDLSRRGASLVGRVKDGNIPVFVEIRPATKMKRAPPSALDTVMKGLTDATSIAAHTEFPLRVRYLDAPKLSFTVTSMDEQAWKRLNGIFAMVPGENNVGIKCITAKLRCTLTAQSGADVNFYFTSTADGPKLKKIELPAEGD
jgi:hypothetical protein